MKEIEFIDYIRKSAGKQGKDVVKGIGDDCAVLRHSRDRYLLFASDMLIEGTHFRIKEAGYERTGRKAVAVNISDIAAMGGKPAYITVSVGVPVRVGTPQVKKIYEGIKKICSEYGITLVGGDTNRSRDLVIDVSILGYAGKERLVMRSGAKKGDLILITGPVRDGKREHLDFAPRLREADHLTKNYRLHSMIDTSDGIAPDIARVCSDSGVGCSVFAEAVPLSPGLSLDDALYYGESFELMFTMGVKEARRLVKNTRIARKQKKYFVIGEITDAEKGFKIIKQNGRNEKMKVQGYEHL